MLSLAKCGCLAFKSDVFFRSAGFKSLFREQGALLILMIGVLLIFFAQELLGPLWYFELMLVPAELIQSWNHFRAGESTADDWRIFSTVISYAFLHGSIEHAAFNLLYCWIFGALLTQLLGWRWMLGIFFVTAIAAAITHVAMNRDSWIPTLGASGAVMGFEGAYLGLAVRWKLPPPHVWPIARPISPESLALVAVVGVCIDYFSLMSGTETGVAYGAHIGGFTMGLFLAALVAPKPQAAW